MNFFTKSLLCIFLFSIFNIYLNAQGCVAIRGFSSCSGNSLNSNYLGQGEFLLASNSRYFESFRHFRGDHEETNRIAEGTQVINNTFLSDITLNYGITNRLSANISLPFANNTRSSMYEHGGNPPNGLGDRHITSSVGISDIRLGMSYWLLDPASLKDYNYSLGISLKLPTGNYDYKDDFYNQGADKDQTINTVVDQSIQLGDGGYAVNVELIGFHSLSSLFSLSSNASYLINPQATNGIKTRNGRSEFSCPDQFALSTGVFYSTPISGLSLFLGARAEGVTATDLIGSSEGYRRPGYVISFEPGISYSFAKVNLNLNLPIALYRNRIQSYEDKLKTQTTGIYTQGDAAFADYLIIFSVNYKLSKSHSMQSH